MQVSVGTTPQQREFFIKGDFTARDEDRFFDVFVQIRSMTEPLLVFNLAQCASVDAAAMGMLVVAAQEAAKRNISRVIYRSSPAVEKSLRESGLDGFWSIR